MNINTSELENNIILLDIEGDIDIYSSNDLKDAILDQIDYGKNKIIVSLKDVTYIDSSGIGVLITTLSKLKKINGDMIIIHVYDSVRKVFELTKLTSFFKIMKSEDEAKKSFG